MKTTNILFAFVLFASCASEHKVFDINSSSVITNDQGGVGFERVGLNDKKEAVVVETSSAATELTVQQNVNLHFTDTLNHEAYMLKWCRRDLADPRLGGDGKLPIDAEVDSLKSADQVREELGLDDDGSLKVVKQTFFADKLKKERTYGETLQKMIKLITRHREECEFTMTQARRKAGIKATRSNTEHLDNGLDVAFQNKE